VIEKYFESWKAKEEESGGLLFNIGIHYFDAFMLFVRQAKRFENN